MQSRAINFSDYSVFSEDVKDIPTRPSLLVNTLNQYSFCMANKDINFKRSLLGSDVLLPDGIAIVLALRLLTGQKIKKVAGADLHQHMLAGLNESSGSCFYLGASEEALDKIKRKMAVEYPNVTVGTYSPPFKDKFSDADNQGMISAVNAFEPDVLFVGMTAPKQEQWAHQHKNQLQAKTICTIGAVFDFYAGTVERPSQFWINLGLEWFIRLLKEPKRMWKRYLYFGPVFIWLIVKEKMKLMNNDNKKPKEAYLANSYAHHLNN